MPRWVPARSRWWIVAASVSALVVSQGSINLFAAGVFLKPVAHDLGFGRGEVATALGIANLASAIATPVAGWAMDRHGSRRIMLPLIVLFAVSTASLSLLQASAWLLVLLYGISGLVGVGQSPTAYARLVARWFDRQRGLALGIALCGVGLGTVLVPQFSTFLVVQYGWRFGYLGLAVAILLLAFIPVAVLIRDPPVVRAIAGAQAVPGMTFAEAARGWRYWSMTLAFLLAAACINGSLLHVVPLLTDRGYSPGTAATVISSAGLALIGGRLLSGWLVDRIFASIVAVFFLLCPMAGLAILTQGSGGAWPFIGTVLLGVGIGAEIDLMSFMIGRYFGVRSFGALHGVMFGFAALGNAVGSTILGWSFQLLHSYGPGFVLFEFFLFVTCILLATLGAYRYPSPRAASLPGRDAAATI
jgi:MFS family permease